MKDRRRRIHLHLDFPEEERSETPRAVGEGTESFAATRSSEHPAFPERLMEMLCETNNLVTALRRMKSIRGLPGADGMTVRGIGSCSVTVLRITGLPGIALPSGRFSVSKAGFVS